MASSQTFLRLEAAKRPLPQVAHILSHYNDYLAEHSAVEKYCTLFYGRIHTRRRTLTFCNAGHPPPFLFRKTNSLRLATGGRVAGLFRDTEFQEETMDLEKGDLLVVFTDGFTEVFNGSEEEFGEERLGDLIRKARKAELEALFERIVAATRDWSGSEDQADDMTMVIIEMEREARAASDGDRAGIIGS
jgi:sigma-B regulation protein RsbU (phosphoserine phosphatase)